MKAAPSKLNRANEGAKKVSRQNLPRRRPVTEGGSNGTHSLYQIIGLCPEETNIRCIFPDQRVSLSDTAGSHHVASPSFAMASAGDVVVQHTTRQPRLNSASRINPQVNAPVVCLIRPSTRGGKKPPRPPAAPTSP